MMKKCRWTSFGLLLILAALGPWLVEEQHAHWWDKLPFFWGIYGFAGCVALIYFSKLLGHYWLHRREDYYD